MKIVFICGSLEPGRDGVGDYTRRLAGELLNKGINTTAIALNDQHILTNFNGIQEYDEVKLRVLRIPSIWKTGRRLSMAIEWINAINPEWVSIQYVPFSFHNKGLPFGLSKQLLKIEGKTKWHVMFHELWVGMATHTSNKHRIWGHIQKLLIRSLISNLKPSIIHTSSKVYKAQLQKYQIKSEILPLFSNIRNVSNINMRMKFAKRVIKEYKQVYLILFGTLHPDAQVEKFICEVASFQKRRKIVVTIQFIGFSGEELKRWSTLCSLEQLRITILGELPQDQISELLSNATIGVTTTVLPLVEKSGTVAAMLEHGLPVICIGEQWQPRGTKELEPAAGIFNFKDGIIDNILKVHVPNNHLGIGNVSKKFIESITKNFRS